MQNTTTSNDLLPANYTTRPITLADEDLNAAATLFNTIAKDEGRSRVFSTDTLKLELTEPRFNIENSTMTVWTPAGELVGAAVLWDRLEPPVRVWVPFNIHPAYYDAGVGDYLLHWANERAQQAVARCAPHLRVYMRTGIKTGYTKKEQMLENAGWQNVRYFFRMLINMADAPPTPTLPDGISIRHYKHPDELEALVHADRTGFKDHWGYVTAPFEEELEEWRHEFDNDPLFDETLNFLAIDDNTGEIAGISLCRWEEWSQPDVGYVSSLAVLPQYRKQGLGLALLQHSFGEFWRRGRKSVSLGVDAGSLTGAVRLYERAGMHVSEQSTAYEKELRAGEVIETTHIG